MVITLGIKNLECEYKDGVPPIEPSPYIEPNEYFDYKFKMKNPPGTYMYHSHVNVMIKDNAGLLGGFIVNNPKDNKKSIIRIISFYYRNGL